jgi:hypothetical protein
MRFIAIPSGTAKYVSCAEAGVAKKTAPRRTKRPNEYLDVNCVEFIFLASSVPGFLRISEQEDKTLLS